MRVGFIGLGSQGGPMARRIAEKGHPTTLWARRPATLEAFADTTARVASSPAELAATSDLVCICVVNDADVEQVVDAILPGLAEGSIVAIHSTVHPDTCRRIAARAQGIAVIDAPVSGGGVAATEGRLLVMAGGDASVVDRCRPVFASYADPVVHLGALGAGQVAKLLNNLLFTANLATAASALELGKALQVDPRQLGEVIVRGTANSFALGRVVAAGGTVDRIAAHAGPLLRKDVRLIAELAQSAGAPAGVVLDAADATLRLMDQER